MSEKIDNESLIVQEESVVDSSEAEDRKSSTSVRYSISSYGADYPVDGLVKRLGSGDIQIPEFQRKFVWRTPQCSRFIESLLIGLPVPGIFLFRDPLTQKLDVIDGQQRLQTLACFYSGLIREREFKLTGVNRELEGKTYKTLNETDKRRIDDAVIHATIVRQDEPEEDRSSIYLVFERLNTGGTPLSPQEIRACIYHGSFNDLLRKLNQNASWRHIYGKESVRAKDQEIILRFYALFYELESYKTPMKLFLSDFMAENRELSKYGEEELVRVFDSTVKVVTGLKSETFRPERALNVAILEAILLGTANRLSRGDIKDQADYQAHADRLVSDGKFIEMYKVSTTDIGNVRGRRIAAERAFADVR